MIGNYRIKCAHDKPIFKIITLPNNRVATCSMDLTIKIWKSNPPYNDKFHILLVLSLVPDIIISLSLISQIV